MCSNFINITSDWPLCITVMVEPPRGQSISVQSHYELPRLHIVGSVVNLHNMSCIWLSLTFFIISLSSRGILQDIGFFILCGIFIICYRHLRDSCYSGGGGSRSISQVPGPAFACHITGLLFNFHKGEWSLPGELRCRGLQITTI